MPPKGSKSPKPPARRKNVSSNHPTKIYNEKNKNPHDNESHFNYDLNESIKSLDLNESLNSLDLNVDIEVNKYSVILQIKNKKHLTVKSTDLKKINHEIFYLNEKCVILKKGNKHQCDSFKVAMILKAERDNELKSKKLNNLNDSSSVDDENDSDESSYYDEHGKITSSKTPTTSQKRLSSALSSYTMSQDSGKKNKKVVFNSDDINQTNENAQSSSVVNKDTHSSRNLNGDNGQSEVLSQLSILQQLVRDLADKQDGLASAAIHAATEAAKAAAVASASTGSGLESMVTSHA
jgi:hypothetical protein